VLEIYGLKDGKQIGLIQVSIDSGAADLELSPSGTRAAIFVQGTRGMPGADPRILVLDLNTNTVARTIDPGIQGGSVAFAGDNTILAPAAGPVPMPAIQVLRISTSSLERSSSASTCRAGPYAHRLHLRWTENGPWPTRGLNR
jgi:hypothetical protein